MLINLTENKLELLNFKQKENLHEKYGSFLDFNLPIIIPDEEIEQLANDFFNRISIAFDSCSNEPKQNAVCMEIQTRLEKRLMSLLVSSKIEVFLNCF